ncbi:MAG: 4Fe-4S dicluster domain-containing protein [Butyricicoccus pullicaecorum]|nr:4Fe-4S dicluster domain-containing protein [Butyricicoccus pullicaecorum]
MRGVYTSINDIRRRVYTEIARMAYEGEDYVKRLEALPYEILPGERASYRESIFLERAIIGERLRLAMGMPVRTAAADAPISDGIEHSATSEQYYEPPLINIIKFACHACPEKHIIVTEGCQGCLAHPCTEVCPKDAIHVINGRSVIDQEKCIRCGRCQDVCPYSAIIKQERPCAKACGINAIKSDEYGRAEIDYNKCVSCGMCLVNCPFGAIADKAQIFQLIQSMKQGTPVYAAVAPAFVGQFGPKVTPEKLRAAMKALGFTDVVEVAVGADLCATQEAMDFLEHVPEKIPFMATSCCPAWSMMAKQEFPELKDCVSMSLTPMVLTARLIKKQHPEAKVVFIGPCAAKKLEARRRTVRSEVDFVLTFEEMMGLFHAKDINLEDIEAEEILSEASTDGRNFAVSGGVAKAVVNSMKKLEPECEIPVASAQGLAECKKLMMMAKAGKYNGYLLEGMACPGGCVAGAGTMQPIAKSAAAVGMYAKKAPVEICCETPYIDVLDDLIEG